MENTTTQNNISFVLKQTKEDFKKACEKFSYAINDFAAQLEMLKGHSVRKTKYGKKKRYRTNKFF